MELHNYIKFDGVTVFFVLSGFLIGGILIKQLEHHQASFSLLLDFWVRRWFRTLPTYFLILTILTVCYSIKDPLFTFDKMASYYIFCQNLTDARPPYFPESWSLSVEEWFYLTIPVLIFALIILFRCKPKNSILSIALFILGAVSFLRYSVYINHDIEKSQVLYHIVIYRLDSIMYGVIGAYIHYYHSKYWSLIPRYLFLGGIFLIVLQKYFSISIIHNTFPDIAGLYYVVFELSITSIAALLLLPYLSGLKKIKYKISYVITIISILSYSMYLTHMSLIKDMIIYSIPWRDFTKSYRIIIPAMYFLYWGLTLVFSALIYKVYEFPITQLRERFSNYKKTKSLYLNK